MDSPFHIFPKHKVLYNELMRNHTTFKIGGPCDVLFLPDTIEDIIQCISICKEQSIPYYILGNGSNILVKDKGFRGVIIKIANLKNITKKGDSFFVEAGVHVPDLALYFLEEGYTGFEFASGIPASLGGAVCMNAGAYGPEMQDVIVSVDIIKDGKVLTLSKEEMKFGYRQSAVKGTDMIIIGATISLTQGNKGDIKEKIDYLKNQRETKQPLEMPSAGSTFKRPKGDFAGRLIQSSGLMGTRVGGAIVSEKHAGFIINDGGATAKDVCDLIVKIKAKVQAEFGVLLEEELICIGEE